MNKCLLSFVAIICAAVLPAADDLPKPLKKLNLSMAELRERALKNSGGVLERQENAESKPIGIINSQKLVPEESLVAQQFEMRIKSKLPILFGAKDAPITVEIVERDDFGAITVFAEERKAFVNVRKLASDGADAATLLARTRKEIIRASYMALGSGVAPRGCMIGPVRTLAELDNLKEGFISPEAAMHLFEGKATGVQRIRFATYRKACEEGWAPAPTNDVQKAIWDKVHQMPTEPIKIKPETKKVSE